MQQLPIHQYTGVRELLRYFYCTVFKSSTNERYLYFYSSLIIQSSLVQKTISINSFRFIWSIWHISIISPIPICCYMISVISLSQRSSGEFHNCFHMARGNDITGTYLIPVRPMPDRNISTVLSTWVFAHAGTYRQTGIYLDFSFDIVSAVL